MKPNQARLFAVFCVLALAGGVAFLRRAPSETKIVEVKSEDEEAIAPATVEVVPAALRSMETIVAAQGILSPGQGASARVAPPVAGRLVSVLVREGQSVRAGQLIALLDNRAAQAQTGSAVAAVEAAQADVNQADLATNATQSDVSNAVRAANLTLAATRQTSAATIRQAREALQQAENDLQRARILAKAPDVQGAVEQARLTISSAQADRDSAVQQAQNAFAQAQTDLEKTKAGARPQEIALAQRAVESAKATRDRAATEVERVKFLFDKGIKPRRDLDDAQTALRVAEAGLQSAQDALNLVQAGARTEDVQAAQLRVEGARQASEAAKTSGEAKINEANAALTLAQKNVGQAARARPEDVRAAGLKVQAARTALAQSQKSGDSQIAGAQAALDAARAGQVQIGVKAADAQAKRAAVRAKQADVSAAQATAATLELRAPLSGLVTKLNLNPGDIADTTAPVAEIANTHALDLMANLPAETGASLRVGQRARVALESAPGRTFPAVVWSIGQIDPQSGLLSVRLTLFESSGALKIGALGTAQIVVSKRVLAVAVPKIAVVSRAGKPVVFVVKGEKASQRAVVVGDEKNGWIEIRSGLNVGESVIRLGQHELEDGGAVKVSGQKAGD